MYPQQQQYYPNYLYNNMQQPQMQPREEHFGFISVNSEQQARNWPIAPGNSLTFKDESAPYIYTKTMGLSQFETPIFEKYRLTKEADPEPNTQVVTLETVENFNKENQEVANVLKGEINNLHNELIVNQKAYQSLKEELEDIKQWMRQPFKNNRSSNKDGKEANQ